MTKLQCQIKRHERSIRQKKREQIVNILHQNQHCFAEHTQISNVQHERKPPENTL